MSSCSAEQLQAVVDFFEPGGVRVRLARPRAQGLNDVLCIVRHLVEPIGDFPQRDVEFRPVLGRALQFAERLIEGGVLIVEPFAHGDGELLQCLGMDLLLALAGQLGQLAADEEGLIEFLLLEAQKRQLAQPFLAIGLQRVQPAAQVAHLLGHHVILIAKFIEVAVSVEQLQLIGGLQKRMTLALAVDVHQQFAELLERRQRDRLIVDVSEAASRGAEAAHQDQLVVVHRRLEHGFRGLALVRSIQLEAADDAQLRSVGADQLAGATFAQQQPERRQQQRLAGAGFAGPGAEAGLQFDADVFDQGHVQDGEFAQHGSNIAGMAKGF